MRLVVKLNFFLYFTLFLLFCIDSATSLRYKSIRRTPEFDISSFENELNDVSELIDDVSDDARVDSKKNDSIDQLNEQSKRRNESKNTAVTESPIDTLLAITRAPIQLMRTILTGNETSRHAREISDIIGYNLKKIVKKFFRIANEALDNFNTINNAGLVSAIIQIANFMTKVNHFVSPTGWVSLMNLDLVNNIRLPLNLRSPNAHHEQFFDLEDL